jgi:FlaA1/EpsC-like NDP-sugar epimerase
MTHPKRHYHNKVVCVTGAGGSIGSEICRKLVEYEVAKLILVGHSEIGLYNIEKELKPLAPAGAIVAVLGSITDAALMERTLEGVDILINAAAHKHVPLCEQNPCDAILNNVGGVMTLAMAANRMCVKQMIQVSSDKAVKPSSVMGATKRVGELYIEFAQARMSMNFTIVRFGNVLNSSGSVLPLWREQLARGEKITLTDKRCTRYFMSIPAAVNLTLDAGTLRPGLYVLDMGAPRSIYEMAVCTVRDHLMRDNQDGTAWYPWDVRDYLVETGMRPGEKLEEELHYGGDLVKTKFDKVLHVREHGGRRAIRWGDFEDLLMAARCRHEKIAVGTLKELVR